MKNEKTKEVVFDAVDEAIAAALGDASAWPAPPAGFRERCAARVAELVSENSARRARWAFAGAQWMKAAAVLVAVAGFAAIVLHTQDGAKVAMVKADGQDAALVAQTAAEPDDDGLYEEVEESYEVASMPDKRELVVEAAKATLPKTPATKVFGALCMAAMKISGV